MSVTRDDIHSVEFSTTRLKEGYDQGEVDAFLDRVAIRVEQLEGILAASENERRQLKAQLAEVERRLGEFNEMPTRQIPVQASRILEAAQRTADDVLAEARREADSVTAEARASADRVLESANAEANRISVQMTREANEWAARSDELKTRERSIREFLATNLEALKNSLEAQDV